MEISKIKVQNLMSGKLEIVLNEIESQIKSKNFTDLDKCVAELAKIGEHLVIKTNEDGTRTATVQAKDGDVTEDIDFMAVLQQLKQKIDTTRVATNKTERPAMKTFRANVEKTIGTLLKENEITQELVSRGVSDRDIIDNGETEITRSQAKVEKLKPVLEEHQQLKALFGEDSYIETAKRWDSKSYMKQIDDAEKAEKKLNEIQKKLEEMKSYAEDLGSLDPEDKAANEAEIAKILKEVNELRDGIKDLQIPGLDLKVLDHINEHDANNIEDKINGTRSTKGVKDIIIDAGDIKKSAVNQMRSIMADPANASKFAKYLPSGVSDPTTLTEKQVLEIASKIDKDIKMYNAEIRYEEEYQSKTRESVDRYKEASERARELEGKFDLVPVQVKIPVYKRIQEMEVELDAFDNPELDEDGNPILKLDEDGNPIPAVDEDGNPVYKVDEDGNPIYEVDEHGVPIQVTDEDGNPVYETDENGNYIYMDDPEGRTTRVATAERRQEALRTSGINDENAYIEQAKNDARTNEETAIATLSAKDKRRLIRQAYRAEGGFHPFKFLRSQFAPSSMWESGYKSAYLTPKVEAAEIVAERTARAELDSKVATVVAPELDELRNSTGIVTVARKYVTEELASAASRNRVLYNVQQGTEVESIKQSAVRAAVVTGLSMEDLYIQALDGRITDQEFLSKAQELRKKKETIQSRAYTDDLRNPQQYGRGHKDTFEDEER